jgi:hypothetical protein
LSFVGWRSHCPGRASSFNVGWLDLEASVTKSLDDDLGRVFGIKDLRWKVTGAEQVGENVLRGEFAHGLPGSPCHLASYSVSSFDSMQARWNTAKLSELSSIFARDIISAAISLIRTQSRRLVAVTLVDLGFCPLMIGRPIVWKANDIRAHVCTALINSSMARPIT